MMVTYSKISAKMVNPRDLSGNTEEEEEEDYEDDRNIVTVSQEGHQPAAVHEGVPERDVWGVWHEDSDDQDGGGQ